MRKKADIKNVEMPPVFLQWQCDQRAEMFAALRLGEQPRFLPVHLPVISTLNGRDARFPIHSATKGLGLLPTDDHLAEHVAEIVDCLSRIQDRSAAETLSDRVETALSLYGRPERINSGIFGGIEIFRGRTYHNLRRDPRASVLFTGFAPQYLSYQFNCEVELVAPGNPHFEFLRGVRLLFDMECFHIQQAAYPLGYVFHIQEVFDKTPHRVQAPEEKRDACPFRHPDPPGLAGPTNPLPSPGKSR